MPPDPSGYLSAFPTVGAGPDVPQMAGLPGRHLVAGADTGVPDAYNDEHAPLPPPPQATGLAPNLQAIAFAPPGMATPPSVAGRPVPYTGPAPGGT